MIMKHTNNLYFITTLLFYIILICFSCNNSDIENNNKKSDIETKNIPEILSSNAKILPL